MRGRRLIHSKDQLGRATSANHPESPGTDSLIFDRFPAFAAPYAGICAKLFRRADALADTNNDAKHNARCAKKSSPKDMRGEIPSLQKPLFHRTFLNFFDACAFARHVLFDHAINFNFDRVNE